MAEAAQPGHRGDRRLGVLQQGARGLQANPLDVATGRHAQFLEKYPGQRTRAHAGLVGEGFQDRSPARLAGIHSSSAARRGVRLGSGVSQALNWAWPPGRLRNITRRRATLSARLRPRSASTSARARSIPAVTPAEVKMWASPSRHRGS